MNKKFRLQCWVSCFFLFFSFGLFSQSATKEELEERRVELQQEIRRINSLRTSNLKKEQSILNQVENLQQKIRATEHLIRVTNQQANLLTREINENQNKIGLLRNELEKLKKDYAKMIRKSYKSKSQQSRIMFLLSAESFLQAYKRLQYMKQYANYRQQQGEEIKTRTRDLQLLNENLVRQKKEKENLIAQNRKTREELERSRRAQQELIAVVRRKEGEFAAQIRRKQQQVNRIDRQIEEIIAAAIAKDSEAKGSTSRVFELTPAAKILAANFQSNKGKLPWPVRSGVVSMKFGTQPHPFVESITINSNGVRIDTEKNAKAKAVFGGIVSEIQAVKGANKAVMVRHGDYITIYNNLDKIFVRKGEEVSLGQELGEVATSSTTGKTTLHFLLYQNTTKLNPEHWIYQM